MTLKYPWPLHPLVMDLAKLNSIETATATSRARVSGLERKSERVREREKSILREVKSIVAI